ncbi:glycoside hydrolase 100 family protein [Cecembia calidifontis]|jgi:glycogen debranching enzyme|uniref:beta-fructofuranosidase n=1 Tax=Cecembia calidifontis TaxID=1187080 RepID=A0A4Q7PC25_9BACT|nr:glycoside hydrolase 100 family protein [Cecembia calidifontis]RZS97567.1 alkaline and neutral invertase-like protein [Cecembia calidifontis]
MVLQIANDKALQLLRNSVTEKGFLASTLPTDNYQRIWARDGVICGLAALASREQDLIQAFKNTLFTLGKHISPYGNVPSNVGIQESQVSYGGLAGRADTGSWWLIGLSLYSKFTGDYSLIEKFKDEVNKVHGLYQAWEYNNKNLIYVPLAGDWADEYILHGYVLYDQVLRYAALKLTGQLLERQEWIDKAEAVKIAIYENYYLNKAWIKSGIHPMAKTKLIERQGEKPFLPASFHPAGYQAYFDALGNALAILFKIHPDPVGCLDWGLNNLGGCVPAFAPIIQKENPDFKLLEENYRFAFRNKPYEFHNGGVWPMVNGFWGLAMYFSKGKTEGEGILELIIGLNRRNDWEFNECFHGRSYEPCGVPYCTWSAAGQLLLEHTISKGFYLLD